MEIEEAKIIKYCILTAANYSPHVPAAGSLCHGISRVRSRAMYFDLSKSASCVLSIFLEKKLCASASPKGKLTNCAYMLAYPGSADCRICISAWPRGEMGADASSVQYEHSAFTRWVSRFTSAVYTVASRLGLPEASESEPEPASAPTAKLVNESSTVANSKDFNNLCAMVP